MWEGEGGRPETEEDETEVKQATAHDRQALKEVKRGEVVKVKNEEEEEEEEE